MKLSVFILGTSMLVSVAGRPEERHRNTGEFGGTYNFANRGQGNTQYSKSDHSKYEVYEPEEYGKGSNADHVFGTQDGHSKEKQYYGHYGSDARREYAKEDEEYEHKGKEGILRGEYGRGTYQNVDNGYKKERGESSWNQGSIGHHNSKVEHGYHKNEENTGAGYYVTEKHNEHDARRTSYFRDYKQHEDGKKYSNEHKKENVEDDRGLSDFGKEPILKSDFNTTERESQDNPKGWPEVETIWQKREREGGLGEYATGRREETKNGGKSSINAGKYDEDVSEDNERGKEKGGNGSLGDYSSSIYDVRKYEVRERSNGGSDLTKQGGSSEYEHKKDE